MSEGESPVQRERETTSPPRTNLQEAEPAEKAPQHNSAAAARRVLKLQKQQRLLRITTMIATTQQNMTTELVCVFILFYPYFSSDSHQCVCVCVCLIC